MSLFVSLAAAGVLTSSVRADAQTEAALKSHFEGRRVTVRLDMPGTQEGVDIHADAQRAFDMDDYRSNIRRYGVAIRAGQSATVTLIKVKNDLIEFQLDGGGYGTFADDTSTSVHIPLVEKSERENDLERRIKDEGDRDRRRRLQHELDELREQRERENRRIEAEKERLEAQKAFVVAERRLHGGSRFNIRYEDRVPPGMRPQDVEAALAEYVDFERSMRPSVSPPSLESTDLSQLRKGMTRQEAEALFGQPVESSQKRNDDLTVTSLVFVTASQRISADFVEDLLVRYTVASR